MWSKEECTQQQEGEEMDVNIVHLKVVLNCVGEGYFESDESRYGACDSRKEGRRGGQKKIGYLHGALTEIKKTSTSCPTTKL